MTSKIISSIVIQMLVKALTEIEGRCGSPSSELMESRRDIYDIARLALERIGVPSSDLYWDDRNKDTDARCIAMNEEK